MENNLRRSFWWPFIFQKIMWNHHPWLLEKDIFKSDVTWKFLLFFNQLYPTIGNLKIQLVKHGKQYIRLNSSLGNISTIFIVSNHVNKLLLWIFLRFKWKTRFERKDGAHERCLKKMFLSRSSAGDVWGYEWRTCFRATFRLDNHSSSKPE